MTPIFSIVIPTKNRADIVGDAITSVLWQTFRDFELVVVDNDDTDATYHAVKRFDDPRLRYVKTGDLSMSENWSAAVENADGEYINIMADKLVLRPQALERIAHHLEQSGASIVTCERDTFDAALGDNPLYRPKHVRDHAEWILSDYILDYFLQHGVAERVAALLPRGYNSYTHRGVIGDIRNSAAPSVCPPSAPDYTFGFLQLAFRDKTWHTYESLFVKNLQRSNGYDMMKKGGNYQTFVQKTGQQHLYNRVPIKSTAIIANMIYNDFLNVKSFVPTQLETWELDKFAYYYNVAVELHRRSSDGIEIQQEWDAWEAALVHEEQALQDEVRTKADAHRHFADWKMLKRAYRSKPTEETPPLRYSNIVEAARATN